MVGVFYFCQLVCNENRQSLKTIVFCICSLPLPLPDLSPVASTSLLIPLTLYLLYHLLHMLVFHPILNLYLLHPSISPSLRSLSCGQHIYLNKSSHSALYPLHLLVFLLILNPSFCIPIISKSNRLTIIQIPSDIIAGPCNKAQRPKTGAQTPHKQVLVVIKQVGYNHHRRVPAQRGLVPTQIYGFQLNVWARQYCVVEQPPYS